MKYLCDIGNCHFYHEGWCSYWDSTTQLMKIRNKECKMNLGKYYAIDKIMES